MVVAITDPVKDNLRLSLNFSGRLIDHLGLQMYQSPVAAIAELVANAWDADAENVTITLPDDLTDGAEIIVADVGGMSTTFPERGVRTTRNRQNREIPRQEAANLGPQGDRQIRRFRRCPSYPY